MIHQEQNTVLDLMALLMAMILFLAVMEMMSFMVMAEMIFLTAVLAMTPYLLELEVIPLSLLHPPIATS